MITFTPLSGGGQRTDTSPLSYLLQVDDVRILLDCGSPDWCPEGKSAAWNTYLQGVEGVSAEVVFEDEILLYFKFMFRHKKLYSFAPEI